MGSRQAQLNIQSMAADPVNSQLRHSIDIKVITDGEHHVLDRLDLPYRGLFQMVVAEPQSPKHLGFEAQRFLASRLEEDYDLYAYFEDDLIVLDPWFFRKIDWFRSQAGDGCVVFPHRIELASEPHPVDRFFIDGPLPESDLRQILPNPEAAIGVQWPGGTLYLESPKNPHAGCLCCRSQLHHWATVPLARRRLPNPPWKGRNSGRKNFPSVCSVIQASWLEIQHWGTSFHCLLGSKVAFPSEQSSLASEDASDDSVVDQGSI